MNGCGMAEYRPPLLAGSTPEEQPLFQCPRVPVLQNRVYGNADSARGAAAGALDIRFNRVTAFGFNAAFDPGQSTYDDEYDNSVPSRVFDDYCDDIASRLVAASGRDTINVFDVGCGNGRFISRMADRFKNLRGVGVDPAYTGDPYTHGGRLTFIPDIFRPEHAAIRPNLVMCRHTLEHIADPGSFLRKVILSLGNHRDVRLYVEVPDLYWILRNNAFWDLCYEHCNYFTGTSLAACVSEAGAVVETARSAFGGQYVYVEALVNPSHPVDSGTAPHSFVDGGNQPYLSMSFDSLLDSTCDAMRRLSRDRKVVIWGMATKGVMFALHLQTRGLVVDSCVDVNAAKQDKFAPLSGYRICAPSELCAGDKLAVICMNTNYAQEIRAECRAQGLDAEFYSPAMDKL